MPHRKGKASWLWLAWTLGGALVLAEVLGRAAGLGALGAGKRTSPSVAFTFDDGPSERTPALLALLEKHHAKATFFVTAEACRRAPDQLEQMRQAGHQIESHGRWHQHALQLTPWQEWQQIAWHPSQHTASRLYRPPYGGHSPWTRLFARLHSKKIALWSLESRDWTDLPAESLARQLLPQLHGGQVVLLHDGPQVTPELLERLLPELPRRGLAAVTLRELAPEPIGWREGWRRLGSSYGFASQQR